MARYHRDINPEDVGFITQSDHNTTAGHTERDLLPQNPQTRWPTHQSLSGGLQPSGDAVPNSAEVFVEESARIPLLGVTQGQRYHTCCHKQICLLSRPVLLVLLWNLFVVFGYQEVIGFTVSNLFYLTSLSSAQSTVYVGVSINAVVLLLFPVAIYMADVKFKRHRTILASVCFAFLSALMVYFGIILFILFAIFLFNDHGVDFIIASSIVVGSGGIAFLISYIAFTANVVQFGMDQLHYNMEDVHEKGPVLFVHWYVWTSNLGMFMWKVDWGTYIFNFDYHNSLLFILSTFIALIVIGVSFCFALYYSRRHTFQSLTTSYTISSTCQFIKLSVNKCWQQTPNDRYDFHARLDQEKEEDDNNPPFTEKQITDFKVSARIFCIILTLGPIFIVDVAASVIPSIFATHMDIDIINGQDNYYLKWILSYNSLTQFMLVLIVIPLYVCFIGPSVYIPGRFKRIGIGIIFVILSLISMMLIDIIGHKKHPFSTTCFIADDFNIWYDSEDSDYIYISSWFIMFPQIFNAFAHLLLDVALYEFICVTSPHGMIGLLFGTLYVTKGIFQGFAVIIILLPFNSWSKEHSFPSCGFVYFFLNIVIAFIALITYLCVARKYRNLKRVDHIPYHDLNVDTIA